MKKIIIAFVYLFLSFNAISQSISAELDAAVITFVKQEKFTGTILVARKGEILLHKAYGQKNDEAGQPNTVNSIYQIASLAKQFTAAVILKLQEQGKLSVKDKVSKYYPGYPNGDKITIHHLLSHTSGIYNYTDNKAFMSGDQSQLVTLDSMIRLFNNQPLVFEPGSRFSYSNSGYTLLGYIIEKVTGKSYQHVLNKLILKPLHLRHSGYDYLALKDSNKTTGYLQYGSGGFTKANPVHPSILYTTGALYSTTGDLYKWHQALMGNRFLSAASIQLLYTPYSGRYGYGWQIDSLYNKKRVSHSGNVAGFKSHINRIPEDDICVIILSNSMNSQPGQLSMICMAILYQQPYQLPVEKKYIKLNDDILRQYTGVYQFNPQLSMAFTLDKHQLFVQPSNQPRFEVFAETETMFFIKDFDMQFEFRKNSVTGEYDEIIFIRNKQSMTGKKTK